MKFPSFKAFLGYALTGANALVALNNEIKVFPSMPPSVLLITGALAAIGGVILHFVPSPNALQPTPNLSVDDTGAALGRASGEAGSAAGKGPFGGAR
jgi:hypothetical protein